GSERPDSIRTIHELTVQCTHLAPRDELPLAEREEYFGRISIDVTGDGFLYNMVRTIVGTLVEVGSGKRDTNWPAEVLAACDRRRGGQSAPPHGVLLIKVDY